MREYKQEDKKEIAKVGGENEEDMGEEDGRLRISRRESEV